jgi:glutamate formiminotransferase
MAGSIVECVPNFSEGRDQATLAALRAALTSVAGVRLLDVQADPSHNRAVFTWPRPRRPPKRRSARCAWPRTAST